MVRLWMLPSCAVLLWGCAELETNPADGGSDDALPQSCLPGETRCVEGSYQLCREGSYVEAFRCEAPLVCAQGLGCKGCDPAVGRGCKNNVVHQCNGSGELGQVIKSCFGLICEAGSCRFPGCAVGARLVYVVDVDYRLLSFDPADEANPFKLIATLACPAATGATPFSMSVDRSARAWVLYSSGELFWVDTEDGSCSPAPYTPGQQGFQLFGMGFVSDTAGSASEKLWIAGAPDATTGVGTNKMGYLDPASMEVKATGPTPTAEFSPELTGTGNGELYAYFPGKVQSFVARIDKSNGSTPESWSVPALSGDVRAWAFAHWGGKFYIFVTDQVGASERSRVLVLDPKTGAAGPFLDPIPYKIVGAGVSTCAPVID